MNNVMRGVYRSSLSGNKISAKLWRERHINIYELAMKDKYGGIMYLCVFPHLD